MTTRLPRGIRNNNPGNIRKSRDPWQGLAKEQQDRKFFTFEGPTWGIRALARILITYQDRHNLRSVRAIIDRWAPPTENNTAAYVAAVARALEVAPDAHVDVHDYAVMRPLVEAIIKHENGVQPYDGAVIDKGLLLAGIHPPPKPSRTIRGGQIAASATVGAGAVEAVQEIIGPAQEALTSLAPMLDAAKWLLLAVTLVGIGLTVYARLDDRRRGINP